MIIMMKHSTIRRYISELLNATLNKSWIHIASIDEIVSLIIAYRGKWYLTICITSKQCQRINWCSIGIVRDIIIMTNFSLRERPSTKRIASTGSDLIKREDVPSGTPAGDTLQTGMAGHCYRTPSLRHSIFLLSDISKQLTGTGTDSHVLDFEHRIDARWSKSIRTEAVSPAWERCCFYVTVSHSWKTNKLRGLSSQAN
jgi:hypothetical protein